MIACGLDMKPEVSAQFTVFVSGSASFCHYCPVPVFGSTRQNLLDPYEDMSSTLG
jgi:hypothetical protein